MKRLVAILLAVTVCARADWSAGFDFRGTTGFVTDAAGMTAVTFETARYPTNRTINAANITFGWETLTSSLYESDYRSDVDSRLAGVNCHANDGTASVFRVDLPATGQYDIEIASGDVFYAQLNHLRVQAGTVSILNVDGATGGGHFLDATGQLYVYNLWSASSSPVRKTLNSTILRVTIGSVADSSYSCISHLRVTRVAPAPSPARSRSFFLQ